MAWNRQVSSYRLEQIHTMTLKRTTKWKSGSKRDPNVRNIYTRNNPPIVKGKVVN